MVNIIAAPETAPQIFSPPPAPPRPPRLDRLDQRLLEVVREEGAVQIWYLLNKIGDEEAPGDRATARAVRLGLWHRLKRLLWLRLIWRHGRKAVGIRPPPPPAIAEGVRSKRLRRAKAGATVRPSPDASAVSTLPCPNRQREGEPSQTVENESARTKRSSPPFRADVEQIQTAADRDELTAEAQKSSFPTCSNNAKDGTSAETVGNEVAARLAMNEKGQETQPAASAEQISQAARALAKLPRRPRRKWTGWLSDGWRGYRDERVLLLNGDVWFLYGALRGKAVISRDKGRLLGDWPDEPLRWALVPASTVRPLLNPAAQILGRAKLGRREKPSLIKAEAAKRNGRMPCREGKQRGRRPKGSAALFSNHPKRP